MVASLLLLESEGRPGPGTATHSPKSQASSSHLQVASQYITQAVLGCVQEAWHGLPELTAIEDRCVQSESNGNHEKE